MKELWHKLLLKATSCLDTALLQHSWVTSTELLAMEEEAKKSLLTEKLNLLLDPESHTMVDLSMRPVSAEQGSLCVLAALSFSLAFRPIA